MFAGFLKLRFPGLKKGFRFRNMDDVADAVVVACVIHNICNMFGYVLRICHHIVKQKTSRYKTLHKAHSAHALAVLALKLASNLSYDDASCCVQCWFSSFK